MEYPLGYRDSLLTFLDKIEVYVISTDDILEFRNNRIHFFFFLAVKCDIALTSPKGNF